MAERVQVREIDDDEGRRLLRDRARGTGRGDLAAGADGTAVGAEMSPAKIAEVTFTQRGPGTGRHPQLQRRGLLLPIRSTLAADRGCSTCRTQGDQERLRSQAGEHAAFSPGACQARDFLVARGWSTTFSQEGLRVLLRDEGVSFQRIKTWRPPGTRTNQAKKPVEHL